RRSVHGRRRCAGARRGARHDGGDRETGDRALHHGRRLCRRNLVRDRAGRVVQAHRQARVPDGAHPSPLRAQGLEGEPGRRALLDHHDAARPVRPFDAQTQMTDYTGRNAVVLGLGLTGYTLARHLVARGADVRVADTRPSPPFATELAAALPGVRVLAGPFTAATFEGADLVAISPGVAKDHPAIAAAVAGGAELAGDIELFARELPPEQKVIAVTGSNGKSTVTALTGALCCAAGLRAVVAGNIGDAALDALPADA